MSRLIGRGRYKNETYSEPPRYASGSGVLAPNPFAGIPVVNIDPQNVSGVASDANSGAPGHPVRTWNGGVIAKYGTNQPYIPATIAFVFISNHTDNTDPILPEFAPMSAKGATVSIQGGTPTIVAAGVVLSGVTAKNRGAGTNSLLIANLGASGAVGQLVQNLTHPSFAAVYKSLGADSFSMQQPLAAQTVGQAFPFPTEVDTWADGDVVNLLEPIAINIAGAAPRAVDGTGAFTIYQCTIFSPNGANASTCALSALGQSILLQTVISQRVVSAEGPFDVYGCSLPSTTLNASLFTWLGGACSFLAEYESTSVIDLDAIFGTIQASGGTNKFGCVYVDTGFSQVGGDIEVTDQVLTTRQLYGSGAATWNLLGNCAAWVNTSGQTFAQTFTAPNLVTGILLNGTGSGSTHTNASPDVITSNVPTTPANLDTNGTIWRFGGASVRGSTSV